MERQSHMEFTEYRISENFWCFEQNGVRSFLLVGPEQSLLIDTCYGGDLSARCKTKTTTPIRLILTHADRDHTGCVSQFNSVSLHPAEFALLEDSFPDKPEMIPLWEDEILDIGSFRFEALHQIVQTRFLCRSVIHAFLSHTISY